ncbi:macrophage mannose receptor 1 [Megalops cyprinoides]|uniref:macrophage mannose receptor 1 n=1 Tax=Megalops cyprinoides TaxID=118141 RepID=UPI001864E0F1|nr:macrophage mannose receptor 1 [Megalops cyprinoides]
MEIILLLLVLEAVSSSRFREFHRGEKDMNWTAAQQYCRQHYTDLVTVHSQEEADQLLKMLGDGDSGWIGLHRGDMSDKWSDGDTSNFINWLNPGGKEPPYCAAMTVEGGWETLSCTEERDFMCYRKEVTDPSLRYTLVEETRSWYDAQKHCRMSYTDLVSIKNESHNDHIKNKGQNIAPFWIGMIHDDWAWSDGGCSTYRNWYAGYPMKSPSDCVYMLKADEGTWFNVGCDNDHFPLCYKVKLKIHLINEPKTWEEAQHYCYTHHRSPLIIQSEQDQHAVQQVLQCKNFSGYVWLGLRQSRLFGFWVWADGITVGWSNWEGGSQPEQPLSHICAAMATGEGGFKWSDQNCVSKFSFLCEG